MKEEILSAYETLNGEVAYDEESFGEYPACIINGKRVKWNDLGRELMRYEGFHFKLHIHDDADNVTLANV